MADLKWWQKAVFYQIYPRSREEPRKLGRFLMVGLAGLEVMARAKSERVRLDDAASVMLATLD